MPTVVFEVEDESGRRALRVVLPEALWAQIEDVARERTRLGRPTAFEEVAAEALGIGLSMTHGAG